MRVYELAKELGVTSKELLVKLKDRKIEAKNHMASLDEDVVKLFEEEKALKTGQVVSLIKRAETVKSVIKDKRPQEKKEESAVVSPEGVSASADDQRNIEKQQAVGIEPAPAEPQEGLKPLELAVPVSIKDLAPHLQIKSSELIKYLMLKFKLFVNINQSLGEEIISEILRDYGYLFVKPPSLEQKILKSQDVVDKTKLKFRSPIVTFMGHVDHGKTSLLDYIRRSRVTESEDGGITQHIGAYEVKLAKGKIAFLDTPGHEAFTAMRARGANVTDIVVLVVAVDDGVMPQTIEAYDHAKAAGVPVIVAMNKIDKPGADMDKLKRQLSEIGLMPEDWGGKTITVGVSAKTGQGVDQLLEMILLEAEMLELKGSYDQPACGVIIEAKLSRGRGPVATVLVQNGILKTGDFIIAGYQSGRVRAMCNDFRQLIKEAGPSTPVEITGLSGVPQAGEKFFVVNDEKAAKEIVTRKQEELKRRRLEPGSKKAYLHLEDLYQQIKEGGVKELSIILKADVQGSLGAIEDSLIKIGTSEVKINVVHRGVGLINTSDVVLAIASNAIIIGFHVEPDNLAKDMAQKEDIDIRIYRVIYEIVNDMKAALEGMLAPKIKKIFVGRAEVKQVFKLTKYGIVAGSIVRKGKIMRGTAVALVRNGQVVHEGKMAALKRFKDDVREVAEGVECGISLENFEDIKEGDFIDCFSIQHVARKL